MRHASREFKSCDMAEDMRGRPISPLMQKRLDVLKGIRDFGDTDMFGNEVVVPDMPVASERDAAEEIRIASRQETLSRPKAKRYVAAIACRVADDGGNKVSH